MNFFEIFNVISGTISLIIAGIVAYIAYGQHKTNKNILKLQKLEKGDRIFEAFRDIIQKIGIQDKNISLDEINEFNLKTQDAFLLLGKDIEDYANEIKDKADEQWRVVRDEKVAEKALKKTDNLKEKREKIRTWFKAQTEKGKLKEKFRKSLSILP